VTRALDCISERSTLALCNKVVKDSPGAIIGLTKAVPLACTGSNVKTSFFLTYTLFGELGRGAARPGNWIICLTCLLACQPFTLLRWVKFDAIPRDRAALAKFYAMLPSLITDKGLRPNQIDLRTGGIAAVELGLNEMRVSCSASHSVELGEGKLLKLGFSSRCRQSGKVSGKKLVVSFA
jgi:hypothetical protein